MKSLSGYMAIEEPQKPNQSLLVNVANAPRQSSTFDKRAQKAHVLVDKRHTFYNIGTMFDWDDEKDEWLRRERGLGFEDILFHIQAGDLLLTAEHPNQEKYPGQKIMYVKVDEYVWMVPYVSGKNLKFMKTIIPSRKATRELLGE